jgi:hypothetical protein
MTADNRRRKPRHDAAEGHTLDEVVAQYAELNAGLREATREAHGAAKDLRDAIREAKGLLAQYAEACELAAFNAARDEMIRGTRHLQQQMNRQAGELNVAIDRAREQATRALVPIEATLDGSKLTIRFAGGEFNAEVPIIDGPLGDVEARWEAVTGKRVRAFETWHASIPDDYPPGRTVDLGDEGTIIE